MKVFILFLAVLLVGCVDALTDKQIEMGTDFCLSHGGVIKYLPNSSEVRQYAGSTKYTTAGICRDGIRFELIENIKN